VHRLEDQAGSSSGSWGLQEYPGLSLFKNGRNWQIKLGALSGPEGPRIWLKPGQISRQSLSLYLANPDLRKSYGTRRELLSAIELAAERSQA